MTSIDRGLKKPMKPKKRPWFSKMRWTGLRKKTDP